MTEEQLKNLELPKFQEIKFCPIRRDCTVMSFLCQVWLNFLIARDLVGASRFRIFIQNNNSIELLLLDLEYLLRITIQSMHPDQRGRFDSILFESRLLRM